MNFNLAWNHLKNLGICTAVFALSLQPCCPGFAQEDDAQDQAATEQQENAEEEKKGPNLDLAEDADLDQVEQFIEQLENYRPTTREEYNTVYRDVQAALDKAMVRMLDLLEEAGETDSPRYFKLKRAQLTKALPQSLQSPEQIGELLQEMAEFFAARGEDINQQDAQMAVMTGYYLTNSPLEDAKKKEYCTKLGEFVKAGGESLESSAEMLEGLARSVGLVGKQFELSGTTLDGKQFDISDLKGKVVLVDFWATWCGPCIAEHPNLERNYAGYKEKGFEIVGVSLDQDRERLEQFCEERDTPWMILHDEGGKNPATTYYGIVGIPSIYLLDNTGTVVAKNVRGPRLAAELAKLLGEPIATEDDEESSEDAGL